MTVRHQSMARKWPSRWFVNLRSAATPSFDAQILMRSARPAALVLVSLVVGGALLLYAQSRLAPEALIWTLGLCCLLGNCLLIEDEPRRDELARVS